MNVYFDSYYRQAPLTLCNASRVGNIQHVENKISQHLKKSVIESQKQIRNNFKTKMPEFVNAKNTDSSRSLR